MEVCSSECTITKEHRVFYLTPDWRSRKARPRNYPRGKALPRFPADVDQLACGAVYLIISLESRNVYVGSSRYYGTRQAQHWKEMRKGTHPCPRLRDEVARYGIDRFAFVPVERGVDLNLLQCREQFWIWRMADRLLNITAHACFAAYMRANPVRQGDCPVDLSGVPSEFLFDELLKRGFRLGR